MKITFYTLMFTVRKSVFEMAAGYFIFDMQWTSDLNFNDSMWSS